MTFAEQGATRDEPDRPSPPSDDYLAGSLARTTGAERAALRVWTGPRHRDIQAALRGETPMTVELEDLVAKIDGALARSPLLRTVKARRISMAGAFSVARADQVQDVVGSVRDALGYISTTLAQRPPDMPGRQRVIVDVIAPAGTPAAYIESVSMVPKQQELLIARGRRFYVTAAEYDRRLQRWVVTIELFERSSEGRKP